MIRSSRRGISTLVGAMLFTVLLMASLSVITLALNTQEDMVNTNRILSDTQLKKQQERMSITANVDSNKHLQLYVNNKGQNPIDVTGIWIINKTASTQPANRFTIDSTHSFIPSGSSSQILSNMPLKINDGSYEIKAVTALGTIERTSLVSGTSGTQSTLKAEMVTIPTEALTGQNMTLAMLVTNTDDESSLTNVKPNTPIISPSNFVLTPLPSNPSSVNLGPGESMLFKWDYRLGSQIGILSFTANATATFGTSTITSNNASDQINVSENDDTLNVINKDLISRPEIFVIKPASFGLSSDKAIWGVNVVNPTGQQMNVTKITISVVSPRAQSNDLIFDVSGGGYCNPTTISPAVNNWDCTSANQLTWKNVNSPVTISPYSVYSFLVKARPGSLATANVDLETAIIHVSVFTNMGEFGKAGYSTSVRNGGDSLVNVFLTKKADSFANADIEGSRKSITSGSVQTFKVAIADLDMNSANYLKKDSTLIINVPKGWKNVTITNSTGFNTPVILPFSDGSSRISATTALNLSGSNGPRAIQFTATAPTVNTTQLYVMYILGEGETGFNFPVGPLSETILQVCPTSGC